MNSQSLLDIKDLSIAYGQNTVVENVTFQVPQGSIVAIVGESGSGKSTLIRSVIGLLTASGRIEKGSIFFEDVELTLCSDAQMNAIRGNQIAMIFQDGATYLDSRKKIGYQFVETIRSHLDLSKKEARQKAVEILERLHLSDVERIMDTYPFMLSGGMCQRVAIAMVMVMNPKLLLADEPTSALDVTIQAQVVRLMEELKNDYGTTILMVTHNMGLAAYLADYVVVMKDGRLVEWGPAEAVIDEPQKAYTQDLLAAVPELQVANFG
ncbi:ABC transporter ATP-binding protein [Eubacteriaceae bacterium ES2]|nr:ABC transporter ATP-binding protein [Eubacteriaceae bacterium ES2]